MALPEKSAKYLTFKTVTFKDCLSSISQAGNLDTHQQFRAHNKRIRDIQSTTSKSNTAQPDTWYGSPE